MTTFPRLIRRFAEAFLIGLLAGIVLLVMVPIAMGWRPYTVLTGSMRPNIHPGDVVMDQPVRVPDVHVGDVVTFSDPSRKGRLVTHRVRAIAHGPQVTIVETRGDANNTSERWQAQTKDRVGRVVYVIPKVGHVATLVRNPLGILLLVVLPVLGLGFLALRSIWTDDEDDASGPQPTEAPPANADQAQTDATNAPEPAASTTPDASGRPDR